MSRVYRGLAIVVLALLLAAPAYADTPTPTPPPTATYTPIPPTATPPYNVLVTLQPSGDYMLIERRYTYGEISIALVAIALGALYGLQWIYDIARREVK